MYSLYSVYGESILDSYTSKDYNYQKVLLDNEALSQELDNRQNKINLMEGSVSWKIGNAITAVPRKLRDVLRKNKA